MWGFSASVMKNGSGRRRALWQAWLLFRAAMNSTCSLLPSHGRVFLSPKRFDLGNTPAQPQQPFPLVGPEC